METRVDAIIDNLKICNALDFSTTKSHINELDAMSQNLLALLAKIDNAKNLCVNKQFLQYEVGKPGSKLKFIKKKRLVAPGIDIDTIEVDTLEDVPSIQLYFVKNIGQFAFKLNNIVFRGNIGNIYNKSQVRDKLANQVVPCQYKNKCLSVTHNKPCKFYHDLHDLRKFGDCSLKYAKIRNFTNTSWIYTDMPVHSNNNNMRHFGSRNSLKYDCDLMNINADNKARDRIRNYHQQTMHDVLVMLAVCSKLNNNLI